MPSAGDFLLYALSTWGSSPWSSFKLALNELTARHNASSLLSTHGLPFLRRKVMRSLEALGHVDAVFLDGPPRIQVSPATLARMPVRGLPTAALCGARVESTIPSLKKACVESGSVLHASAHAGIPTLLPERVTIEATSSHHLLSIATSIGAAFEDNLPAYAIGENSMSLEDCIRTLEWEAAAELTWVREDFDPARLQFGTKFQDSAPLRLSSYANPVTSLRVTYLWDKGRRARVDRDWGRYAVLSTLGRNVLWYHPDLRTLYVPRSIPLPKYLARAALLCSGMVEKVLDDTATGPQLLRGTALEVFSGVPFGLAKTIARKTGQALQSIDHAPRQRRSQ